MKSMIIIIMLAVLLIAGCSNGSNGSNGLGGLAITLGGNLLCGALQGIPFIGEYCGEIIGLIFGVDAGTIEVRKSNGQWVTLTSEPMEINLLGNSPEQQLMVFKQLQPGTYDKIRIDLKDIKVVTKDGIETTTLPSRILEFDTNIVIDRNGKSLVELNLDIANSLHITDDNKVVFAPVLDIESKRNVDFEVVPVTSKKTKEAGVKTLSLNKAKGVSEMGVDVTREAAVVKSGVTFDKRKVGMDLNGNMKKNFVLDKSKQITIVNNKPVVKNTVTTKSLSNTGVPVKKTPLPVLPTAITGAAIVTQPIEPIVEIIAPQKTGTEGATLGSESAPVTIIEFGDYQCPFCARFHAQTFQQLKTQYIDTGKVKFVYRDFPLSFHTNAQKAAETAKCAGEQGKYWEMHDYLLSKGVNGGVTTFKQYAQELGLSTQSFNVCLDSGLEASAVQKDFNDGVAMGVQGTPGFFINGRLVSGAQPFSVFEQLIKEELNVPAIGTNPPPITDHNIQVTLNNVVSEWKGTYGKITAIQYSITNHEESTIQPDHFVMIVEGYDNFEKRILLPLSSKSINAGETKSANLLVPNGFAYSPLTAGDLSTVMISISVYDANGNQMTSNSKEFNLQG